ncbi:hypothetical protein QUB28_05725 [Microcoleus sp. B4-C3]
MPVPQNLIFLWNFRNRQDACSTKLNFLVERASCPLIKKLFLT